MLVKMILAIDIAYVNKERQLKKNGYRAIILIAFNSHGAYLPNNCWYTLELNICSYTGTVPLDAASASVG